MGNHRYIFIEWGFKIPINNLTFTFKIKIGIVIIIMSAFFLGSVAAITKKTSNDNNHWSLVNLYVAYPGLPLNLMFSGIFYYFGFSKISDKGASIYITPVLLSCLSALIKLGGFTFSTMAFKYEDATKVKYMALS